MRLRLDYLFWAILLWLLHSGPALALLPSAVEIRYCGPECRAPTCTASRSSTVIRDFRKVHPCPETGITTGACAGWSIDHVIPLVCGGCDAVSNMQWLPNTIKSCAGTQCKDRWEQKVYCR